jgi:hypothetical protein
MVAGKPLKKVQLMPEVQAFIRVMQRLHFGKIKNITIRDGVPILRPAPVKIKTVKLGNAYRRRPEIDLDDFALKTEVRDLLEMISKIRNGVVKSIEVRDGLPSLVKFEDLDN